jgi:amidophosphoribosyltransferase
MIMCGIAALFLSSNGNLLNLLVEALRGVQHRGYDANGIAYHSADGITLLRNYGLISGNGSGNSSNSSGSSSSSSSSSYGLAHVRYRTGGDPAHIQPLISDDQRFVLVHNGHIRAPGYDSQFLLDFIVDHITDSPTISTIQSAIIRLMRVVEGSYSCILMIANFGLVAFRDPNGIRPLCYGKNHHGDWLIASESVVHTKTGFICERDIAPGEILILTEGSLYSHQSPMRRDFTPCLFEYIYLAHPDSKLDGLPVRYFRQQLGILLAKMISAYSTDIDYIIPIPESSTIAAQSLAQSLKVPYKEALLKVGLRTFILPDQATRETAVRGKFQLLDDCAGKNILLVDDSIIRGTTLKYIVSLFAKCKSIMIASTAPAVIKRNLYGINIPDESLLIANKGDVARQLGVKKVFYQSLESILSHFGMKFEISMFISQ